MIDTILLKIKIIDIFNFVSIKYINYILISTVFKYSITFCSKRVLKVHYNVVDHISKCVS